MLVAVETSEECARGLTDAQWRAVLCGEIPMGSGYWPLREALVAKKLFTIANRIPVRTAWGTTVRQYLERVVDPASLRATAGWTRHDGGACPVADHALVKVLLRDGSVGRDKLADSLFWHHDGRGDDIVAWHLELAPTGGSTVADSDGDDGA